MTAPSTTVVATVQKPTALVSSGQLGAKTCRICSAPLMQGARCCVSCGDKQVGLPGGMNLGGPTEGAANELVIR
jgi:hypothetical protein